MRHHVWLIAVCCLGLALPVGWCCTPLGALASVPPAEQVQRGCPRCHRSAERVAPRSTPHSSPRIPGPCCCLQWDWSKTKPAEKPQLTDLSMAHIEVLPWISPAGVSLHILEANAAPAATSPPIQLLKCLWLC